VLESAPMAAARRSSAKPKAKDTKKTARPAARRAARKGSGVKPESDARAARRAGLILDRLEAEHPEAACALSHRSPYELLMATILSAQCTDERVNQVTPELFRTYPSPRDLARALPEQLEAIIRSTGFFRAKARSLIGCARALVESHAGEVPAELNALVRLPGIGRKTANVVLGHAFDVAEGIAVDTHVLRVGARLGLTEGRNAVAVEARLMRLLPRERWTRTTDLLIFHGRKVCDARRPACGRCATFDLCRWDQRQAFALPQPRGDARRRRG